MRLHFLSCICLASVVLQFYPGHASSMPWRPPVSNTHCKTTNHTGTYLVIAPEYIRPNTKFTASIHILPDYAEEVAVVTIGICSELVYGSLPDGCSSNNRSCNGHHTAIATTVSAPKGKPTIATIQLPASLANNFRYLLCGNIASQRSGEQVVEWSRPINVNRKKFSILIQTDKPKYNPGNTINYRVFVVDPHLKPVKGVVDIEITDPKRNLIQRRRKIPLQKGVLTHSLQLTDEPVLGNWQMKVILDDVVRSTLISVDKYVLPKFEIKLDYPTSAVKKEDIQVIVEGVYTYGKPVQGKAMLVIEVPGRAWWDHNNIYAPIYMLAELDTNGKAKFDVGYEALTNRSFFHGDYYHGVRLSATVTEQLTDIEQKATESMTFYDKKHKVTIDSVGATFKPGLDLPIQVTVLLANGDRASLSPEPKNRNASLQITFTYTQRSNSELFCQRRETRNVVFPIDGSLSTIVTSQDNDVVVDIEIFVDSIKAFAKKSLTTMKSGAQSFIQIDSPDLEEVGFEIGQKAEFVVKLTKIPVFLGYQVIAKQLVMESGEIPIDQISDNKVTVSFDIVHEMAPRARLIVYGVMPSGVTNSEVIADVVNFQVNGAMQHKVDLTFTPNITEPYTGEMKNKVQLSIQADPDSFVAVLAVDKSVKLLGTDNDIAVKDVEYASASLDYYSYSGYSSPWWRYVYGDTVSAILDLADVSVVTDSSVYQMDYSCATGLERQASNTYDASSNRAGFTSQESPGAPQMSSRKIGGRAKKVVIREDFPETWLWMNVTTGKDGSAIYSANVPDTITTWVASAIALNDVTGLGIANEATMRVFRPFFVSLNLPYAVKRGEELALQVLVFNYNAHDELVRIELEYDHKSGFDFVGKLGTVLKSTKPTKTVPPNIRYVAVPHGGSATVFFPIVPTVLGDLPLVVKAYGSAATDGVKRNLLVEAEGIPLYFNKPMMIDLTGSESFESEVHITDTPADMVEGSDKAIFSVVGDLMSPILDNIHQLVRMPYGCGEQNMVNFVPNIVVLDYLTAVGKLTPEIKEKAIRYMEAGYQRQMNYYHGDGSFSAFGMDRYGSRSKGSTWLTAFVLSAFSRAQRYIEIDEKILRKSAQFLAGVQDSAGVFEEFGYVYSKRLQGGSAKNRAALTAYVIIALSESDQNIDSDVVKNATVYLEDNLRFFQHDPFVTSIVSYALQKVDSGHKDEAVQLLHQLAVSEHGLTHWEEDSPAFPERPWWYYQTPPANVEMTSYALLAHIAAGQNDRTVPIVRWLLSQRNSYGGFGSTQDTIIGIQALALQASTIHSNITDMQIKIVQGLVYHYMDLADNNALVLQQAQLDGIGVPIKVSAEGVGVGYGQISYSYNVLKLDTKSPFECTNQLHQLSDDSAELELCCRYLLDGDSNMALLEVETLSGFAIDTEKLEELKGMDGIRRVETTRSGSKTALYIDSMNGNETCLNITQDQAFQVAKQKPAAVKLRDYYEPNLSIDFTYELIDKRSLDDQCPECWPVIDETEECVDQFPACGQWLSSYPNLCNSIQVGCEVTCNKC